VSVAGVAIDNLSWDKFSGGEVLVDSQMHSPGGMQPTIALGGRRSRSPAVIERIYSDVLAAAYVALDNAAGRAAVTCSIQYLAPDRKTAIGAPITYTGILGPVKRPDYDSMTSTPGMLSVTVDLNEVVS